MFCEAPSDQCKQHVMDAAQPLCFFITNLRNDISVRYCDPRISPLLPSLPFLTHSKMTLLNLALTSFLESIFNCELIGLRNRDGHFSEIWSFPRIRDG
jgi:hypothetical protein